MINTVAETSNYLSTSHYEDVMTFVAAVVQSDPNMRVETFGTTNEGRALPLVIAGPPGVVDPQSARATGLPVVFVMANIHAGEVEGKEAAQMFVGELQRVARRHAEADEVLSVHDIIWFGKNVGAACGHTAGAEQRCLFFILPRDTAGEGINGPTRLRVPFLGQSRKATFAIWRVWFSVFITTWC